MNGTINGESDANRNLATQDTSQKSLSKEVKRGHTLSFKRHRAYMNIETEYLISDDGKKFLKDQKNVKESGIPSGKTENKTFFDNLIEAANQKVPAGKIALWKDTLRLQNIFAISFPNRNDKKLLTAEEIHSSGLPIIVADYIKKHGSRFGICNVEVKPFTRADDHLKIYLNCSSGSLSSSKYPICDARKTLATILGMKAVIRFMNCNQHHRKGSQKEVRDRFCLDLCSPRTEPVIQTLLERCLRLFMNTYIKRKHNSSLFDNHADGIQSSIPQIDQLADAMTSITLENKQNGRLQKAFSLLSDIVKVKEGVIPSFNSSDTSKSRAERQTVQWIFQTALMRGEDRMHKDESYDRIREVPGMRRSYHDSPNKLIQQQKLDRLRNTNVELTLGRTERGSVQQCASPFSSQLSSVVNQAISPLLDGCHVENHNNLVVSKSIRSARSTMVKIPTEKASDIDTSAAFMPSTFSNFLGGIEVSSRVKQSWNKCSLAANEAEIIRFASKPNQLIERNRNRKDNRAGRKTSSIKFADLTFDLEYNSSITAKNNFSALTATPSSRKRYSVTDNECDFVLEKFRISKDSSKPNKQVDKKAQVLQMTKMKGTSLRNAIDVEKLKLTEFIDLTAEKSKDREKESKSDLGFDFEVTKVVVQGKGERKRKKNQLIKADRQITFRRIGFEK